MTATRRLRALLVVPLALACTVVAGSVTGAATPRPAVTPTTVMLRGGLNDPKDPNIAVLQYLPSSITVVKNETVTWSIAGPEPHSVTFVAPGQPAPSVDKDPTLFLPTPPSGPYDGSSLVNSGVVPVVASSSVAKFSVSFSKPGTFTYYCVLHPNMVGTVKVTDDAADSQGRITQQGNKQLEKWLAEGEAAKKKLLAAKPKPTKNTDGSSTWTVEMGASTAHTDVLAFAPSPAKVHAGDSVVFVNDSEAPHTASFGGTLVPTNPLAADVQSAVPEPSPQALAPGAYFNTGWVPPVADPAPGFAQHSYTYSIAAPGKYEYVCVLHVSSGMGAELDVG